MTPLLCFSCGLQTPDNFKVETTSPLRTYRLIFEGRREPPNTDPVWQSEKVKLTVMKGQEVFFMRDPFFEEGSLDPHFRDLFPVLQWFNDSALRMGEDLSRQLFSDEIVFHNRTGEKLDVVAIGYGRDERFFIFDFAPEDKVELKANPQFRSQWGAARTVIYQAYYKGQTITGQVEGRKRERVADGPLKYVVEITRAVEAPKSNNSLNRSGSS